MPDVNELMTITEAADALNVSRRAIYDAIEAGTLEVEHALGKIAVKRASLANYVPRAYQGRRTNLRPEGTRGPGGRPPKKEKNQEMCCDKGQSP